MRKNYTHRIKTSGIIKSLMFSVHSLTSLVTPV